MWLFIFLVYLLVYGFNIQNPPNIYHDEYFTVTTSRQILHLSGYTIDHPPVGILLMAASMGLFGDHSWVWRLSSLLSGFGCIVLTFLITRRITGCLRTASLAAFLFALDGLTVVLSRIATLNSVMLFFMLFGLYWLLLCLEKYKTQFLLLSALCLGLGIATRWVAGATLIPLAFVFIHIYKQNPMAQRLMIRDLTYALAVGLAVYFFTFVVFLFIQGWDWQSILTFQTRNFHVLSTIPEREPSSFWQWPLLVKPVIFCQWGKSIWLGHPGWYRQPVHIIMALGNPAIVWAGCVAVVVLCLKFFKRKPWSHGFILVCFFAFWMIPCAFMNRQKFSYYFYPAMPFLCMALGIVMNNMLQSTNLKKTLAYSYLGLAMAMFVYWYPLWTFMQISDAFYQNHLWLKSWPSIL